MEIKSKIMGNKAFSFLLLLLVLYQDKKQPTSEFQHISPSIAWMEVGDFLEIQNRYSVNFQDVRDDLTRLLENPFLNGTYGIYFEDLETGAWIGINERDAFVSASLLKVPVMVAILKKVEMGELSLDEIVFLSQADLDSFSGTLYTKGAGYKITVRELLVYLIKESDNTALRALQGRFLSAEEVLEARLAMGLPIEGESISALGPKHYSSILRSLYYSAYLRRTFSEMALSLMSETDYNNQISAGVPKDVAVSHKVGFAYENGIDHYHDCGIVYHKVKPYILCVMSSGADEEEANQMISEISRIVYNGVEEVVNKD